MTNGEGAHPISNPQYRIPNPQSPILQAKALTIGYHRTRGQRVVVADCLDFGLRAGELVCLLGPNGAGKSTLMRTLARLQPPLAGQVWLDGRPLEGLRPGQLARRLSVVLTDRVDVGALTGYGLVSLGRHPYTGWTGSLTDQDRQIVAWALQAVHAVGLADRQLLEMSDGERQKILIARALAQQPLVMLLDEPTAFLDLPRRVEVMALLRRLAQENGQAILLSTHDLDLALRNADRLWLLSGDGALFDGVPEDLVLGGAFEQVFAGEGVAFDRASGSFHTQRRTNRRACVRGNGPAGFWAKRALERIGFQVIENQAEEAEQGPPPVSVDVREGDVREGDVREGTAGPIFVLHDRNHEQAFADIEGLVSYLDRKELKRGKNAKTNEDLHT